MGLKQQQQEEYHLVRMPNGKYYMRRKPYHYSHPSLRQEAVRGSFAKAAYDTFDEKGYREVDGDLLPPAAVAVKEQVKPLPPPPPREIPLSPYAYTKLLLEVDELRMRGEDVSLEEVIRRQGLKLIVKRAELPEIEVTE